MEGTGSSGPADTQIDVAGATGDGDFLTGEGLSRAAAVCRSERGKTLFYVLGNFVLEVESFDIIKLVFELTVLTVPPVHSLIARRWPNVPNCPEDPRKKIFIRETPTCFNNP